SRDTPNANASDRHLDFARCERIRKEKGFAAERPGNGRAQRSGESRMSELPPSEPFVPVPPAAAANTHTSAADYERLYAESIADPDAFWAKEAERLDWFTPPTKI